ncbi:hypothetical protein AGMMS50293_03400 [Spirochaetia bacterium]|nr:hypothetical protein AGMMS50293_03400 [Spirochaetia bacterium]
MTKKIKRRVFFAVLLLFAAIPAFRVTAQTTVPGSTTFDTSGFPLWAKDIRRWEIIAFGSYPFTMFTATFFMDTYRWIDNNGMSWSAEGRRYAPWPLKSAGAVDMSNQQHEMTLIIAAGLSVAIAFTDLIIVQIKRQKARRIAENMPPGTAIIIKKPWPENQAGQNDGSDNANNGAADNGAANGAADNGAANGAADNGAANGTADNGAAAPGDVSAP